MPRAKRLSRKYVTLVAGFRCKDGFVVAADTAITYGDIVVQGHKLADHYGKHTSYDIVIGGAGDGVYTDMASQKIRDAVAGLPNPTLPAIKAEVEKIIFAIHSEHIFKFWEPEDPTRPSLALIIAIQDQQKEWALLHSDRNAVAEADEHGVVGSGSVLAEHLIEKIWIPGLSTAVTVHLARQLFREMKGKGIYVGGNTEIIGRRARKEAEEFFDLPRDLDYRFMWGMEDLQLSAVRVALDVNNNRAQMTKRVADIRKRLNKLRDATEETRTSKGDTIRFTEFGTEYGDWFKDY